MVTISNFISLLSDRYGLLDKRRKQLPPEIDDAAPVIKRQAVEFAENSPQPVVPSTVKWNPYEASHSVIKSASETPTLSDLFLRIGANALATITGTGGHGKPATNDISKDSSDLPRTLQPLTNFLNDYTPTNNGSDDSDSESKDES